MYLRNLDVSSCVVGEMTFILYTGGYFFQQWNSLNLHVCVF